MKEKEDNVEEEMEEELTVEMEDTIETRKRNMTEQDDWIVDYEFDLKKSLSCRLTLSVNSSAELFINQLMISQLL